MNNFFVLSAVFEKILLSFIFQKKYFVLILDEKKKERNIFIKNYYRLMDKMITS